MVHFKDSTRGLCVCPSQGHKVILSGVFFVFFSSMSQLFGALPYQSSKSQCLLLYLKLWVTVNIQENPPPHFPLCTGTVNEKKNC